MASVKEEVAEIDLGGSAERTLRRTLYHPQYALEDGDGGLSGSGVQVPIS